MRSRPAPSSVFSAAARWSTAVRRSVSPSPSVRAWAASDFALAAASRAPESCSARSVVRSRWPSTSSRVGGALLAGARRVLAGGVRGLAGGRGGLTGAERLGLGAGGLAARDLELAAVAGDQLAQLLDLGAAALLRALGERERLARAT